MKITVVGGGAWGTALATVAARGTPGINISLLVRDPRLSDELNTHHTNRKYTGELVIPSNIVATTDSSVTLSSDVIVMAVPAQHTRSMCESLNCKNQGATIVLTAKGIELSSSMLMGEIVTELLPGNNLCALSGPALAKEVIANEPTMVTLGGDSSPYISKIFSTQNFHTETTRDMIGVQLCGAIKNVLGIAFGFAAGKEYSNNTKARLFSRAIQEMKALCTTLGGNADTVYLSCGVGDMFLSCNSLSSRNTSLGYELSQDRIPDLTNPPEGYHTAVALHTIIRKLGLDLPLCSGVYRMLSRRGEFGLAPDLSLY